MHIILLRIIPYSPLHFATAPTIVKMGDMGEAIVGAIGAVDGAVDAIDNADETVETTNTIPEQRQTMLDLFAAACTKQYEWKTLPMEKQRSIIRRIERSCHRAAIHMCEKDRKDRTWESSAFIGRYSALCYKVLANLDSGSSVGSEYLTDMIISSDIDPRAVGELSSATLFPEGSAEERNIIAIRREQKIQEKFSEKYKCSKCHARKCVWYGVQTRGLDEPEDKHCRCLECGHQWKEGG